MLSFNRSSSLFALAGLAALGLGAPLAKGQFVTGVPVPALAPLDDAMVSLMDARDLNAGVLAVMRDDRIVYQRGFGLAFSDDGVLRPLPEITPMRIGSITKVMVGRAVALLDADGALGPLGTGAHAFDVGQPGGGILHLAPWPNLQDPRIGDITVAQLLSHTAGIVNNANNEIAIGQAMGSCPPGIDNMIRYTLGQMLVHPPGQPNDPSPYVNMGYAVLARIVQEVSGLPLDEFIRRRILTPEMWIPGTELFGGQPFRFQQNPREPFYATDVVGPNVFDCGATNVTASYGGFDLIATVGAGGIVCSAAPLVTFVHRFMGPNSGFVGGIAGSSACAVNRADGTTIAVIFAESNAGDPSHAADMVDTINAILDAGGINWPTFALDGFWVDFGLLPSGTGGHNDPFRSMSTALAATTAGTRLRFKPGTSAWTGTITERMRLDAPFGTVRIGQ